jgi:NADH-quinone oxidoreductase subunit L
MHPFLERILSLEVMSWMVLLFPLMGFVVLALLGDAIKKDKEENGAGILACVTVLLAFACAVRTVWLLNHPGVDLQEYWRSLNLPPRPEPYQPFEPGLFQRVAEFNWINVAGLRVPFALLLDQLTAVMILVVTGVGSLIHIYSLGYMAHDEERVRYFSYLNLFTFFMLLLVMGASLPLMFVGWEGVGLCSYLLIGFWYKKKSASDAGMKAFIVNRIGDAGLILGTILVFYTFGSFDFIEITEAVATKPGELPVITAICLLLFVGACGKSAQIPLHVWLPDAMEGPTPVSALIHAATMVTAGVYMVARLAPLYSRSTTAMTVVAVVGAATALMAATIALVQTDIKRVLAYSTVSQLGYMFLACGVGAFGVGIFHLFTHAFFKALLFLGSGSVIHAMSGEQDMRKMGGLAKKIPWTFGTFAIGTAAIAGIPFLSGAISKEEILAHAYASGHKGLFYLGVFTALLTAFYMSRLLFLTFFGEFRGDHETEHHVHESPWTMLGPLVLLAIGSIAVGFIHIPEFIKPVLRLEEGHRVRHMNWLLYLATAVALAGIFAAYYLYVMFRDLPGRIRASLDGIPRILEEKYGFDLLYNWIARKLVVDGSSSVLWKGVDAGAIDGAVNGSAWFVDGFARAARFVQTGLVRAYVLLIFGGAVAVLSYLLWLR